MHSGRQCFKKCKVLSQSNFSSLRSTRLVRLKVVLASSATSSKRDAAHKSPLTRKIIVTENTQRRQGTRRLFYKNSTLGILKIVLTLHHILFLVELPGEHQHRVVTLVFLASCKQQLRRMVTPILIRATIEEYQYLSVVLALLANQRVSIHINRAGCCYASRRVASRLSPRAHISRLLVSRLVNRFPSNLFPEKRGRSAPARFISMESERWYFHWSDWLVFVSMLGISTAAGLWHFYRGRRLNTADYLLGGHSLRLLPVSASLIASYVSGVTILGTPVEVYNFGTQYWVTVFSILASGITVILVYLPVFCTLGLNSAYEYLEIRFSRPVRILISFVFVVDAVLYQSIVVFVPSLALNQVSGLDVHLIGSVVCLVCVFYTVLGGLRAVVWTDTIQVGIMMSAVFVVSTLGTYNMGGFSEIWERGVAANRIEFFNFSGSPYTRHTFWTVLVGSWLYMTSYISVNQTFVQRYQSLPTQKIAKIAVGIFTIGVMLFVSLCCWCGLVLVAWWSPPNCDPRASGLVKNDDQMLPAYVMSIAGHLHGIPGLFVTGIFGAALSTLSVGLNSTSVVLLEDFLKGCCRVKPSERFTSIFVKVVAVCLGITALAFVFLVEKLGGVLAVTGSLAAIAAGTSFGVFTLGMLFPWTNSKGAFIGAIAGYAVAGWASLGANASYGTGQLRPQKLPVNVSYCPVNVSDEFQRMFEHHDEADVFPLYRLSYHLISGLGAVVVILVGIAVSFATGPRDPASMSKNLFSPIIHRWLPKRKSSKTTEKQQTSVGKDVDEHATAVHLLSNRQTEIDNATLSM